MFTLKYRSSSGTVLTALLSQNNGVKASIGAHASATIHYNKVRDLNSQVCRNGDPKYFCKLS